MTLRTYNSGRLNMLALRLLDLATGVRELSKGAEDAGLSGLQLNDKKALEHVDKLEAWLLRAANGLRAAQFKERGRRAAKKAKSLKSK